MALSFQLFGVKEVSSLASAPKWKSPGKEELLRSNLNTVSNAAFVIRQCYALAVKSIRQSLADAREAAEDKTVLLFPMICLLSFAACNFMWISTHFGVVLSSKTRRSHQRPPVGAFEQLRSIHPQICGQERPL